jgi:hypothetical protein
MLLIAGLLLIVVSPLIRKINGSQINNATLIKFYYKFITTTDAHLNKKSFGLSWIIIYIISYRNVGVAFSYMG